MLYYKVVYRGIAGDLQSAIPQPTGWRLQYQPGEWTEAPTSGIFVFEDLTAARTFGCGIWGGEVWSCDAEDPRSLPLESCIERGATADIYQEFWSKGARPEGAYLTSPPPGTLLFGRVKLIARLV